MNIDLGLVIAVEFQSIGGDVELLGDFANMEHFGALGDLDVGLVRHNKTSYGYC